jgi:hypothetical protein
MAAALTAWLGPLGGTVEAAAWTRPPGATFLSASVGRFATDDGGYRESTVALYGERGAATGVTVGGAVEIARPDGDGRGGEAGARVQTTASAFVRLRLLEGAEGDPLSLQIGVGGPLDETIGDAPAQTADEPSVDLRALYGRGFATRFGDAFANVEGGVRLRFEDSADEARLDLTAGLRPAPRLLALAQVFATLGLRNGAPGGDDYDVLRVAPAVGYEAAPGVTLLLGAERDVAGRAIDEGTRLRLSVWTEF